jgi:hypothetical protein
MSTFSKSLSSEQAEITFLVEFIGYIAAILVYLLKVKAVTLKTHHFIG